MIDESQLASLSVIEKLRLVTTLWDQISRSEQPIIIPDAVLNDASQRIDEMLGKPSQCLSEEEMWRQANALR